MTKQATTTADPEEKPTPELLLRRFKLMKELIDKAKQANIDAGLDPKYSGYYLAYQEPFEKTRYEKWLASVTNPKRPGKFWQISDLKAADLIGEDEESENESKTYPYRRLSSLIKIKNKEGIWLQRIEQWVGLDISGSEKTVPVNDLDYYVKPPIEYQRIPKDPTNKDGPTIRVGFIRPQAFSVEQPGQTRVYITPYSKECVDEYLRYAVGPINGRDGISLALKKSGITNEVSATYEQFTSDEDFDTLFDFIRRPAPDFKDIFTNEMKKRAKQAAQAEDNDEPYQ